MCWREEKETDSKKEKEVPLAIARKEMETTRAEGVRETTPGMVRTTDGAGGGRCRAETPAGASGIAAARGRDMSEREMEESAEEWVEEESEEAADVSEGVGGLCCVTTIGSSDLTRYGPHNA